MRESTVHRIKDLIKPGSDIHRKEAQYEESVFLKEGVLPPVATIGFLVLKVLGTVEFDDQFAIGTVEIDFHVTALGEGNGKRGIQFKTPGGFR